MTYVQYAEPYPADRGDRFGATAGRDHPHRGQDTAPGGLPALAVATGTIVSKRWSNALGNIVTLAHADGKKSNYCHLASQSVYLVGRVIQRGQSVGAAIGSTGSAAQGRHLHYCIGDDIDCGTGHVQDPLAWIAAHAGPETANTGGALYTATQSDGIPGPTFWKLAQLFAKSNGYAGPIDGLLGAKSWAGIQAGLRRYGYQGPLDGQPGTNTYKALQRLATAWGYAGPIDGKPGANTWRAVAKFLNATY